MVANRGPQYWIERLNLKPHVEGGYFAEVYRSPLVISAGSVSAEPAGIRSIMTAIYFLLAKGQFSAFHRLKSDEIWHYYYGSALEIYQLTEAGAVLKIMRLGNDLENRENLQVTVPAGDWIAGRPVDRSGYTLFGCTVAPGFEYADFELGSQEYLTGQFPGCRDLIEQLTLK